MTRAPKPPRVVWLYVALEGPWAGTAWPTRRRSGEGVFRYILAPTPKRKRGKR